MNSKEIRAALKEGENKRGKRGNLIIYEDYGAYKDILRQYLINEQIPVGSALMKELTKIEYEIIVDGKVQKMFLYKEELDAITKYNETGVPMSESLKERLRLAKHETTRI